MYDPQHQTDIEMSDLTQMSDGLVSLSDHNVRSLTAGTDREMSDLTQMSDRLVSHNV